MMFDILYEKYIFISDSQQFVTLWGKKLENIILCVYSVAHNSSVTKFQPPGKCGIKAFWIKENVFFPSRVSLFGLGWWITPTTVTAW